jgi:adenylosuccinate lyase
MLFLMANILSNLEVDEERMKRNLGLTDGRVMSEAVMIALAGKGMNRQEAHELVRQLAIKSEGEKTPFADILSKDKVVSHFLNKREIDLALDPENYLGTAVRQVELAVEKTMKERQIRGL